MSENDARIVWIASKKWLIWPLIRPPIADVNFACPRVIFHLGIAFAYKKSCRWFLDKNISTCDNFSRLHRVIQTTFEIESSFGVHFPVSTRHYSVMSQTCAKLRPTLCALHHSDAIFFRKKCHSILPVVENSLFPSLPHPTLIRSRIRSLTGSYRRHHTPRVSILHANKNEYSTL